MAKPELRRGFVKDCEEMSLEFRKEMGLKPHEYLSARLLADELGIDVLTFSEIEMDSRDLNILHLSRVSGLTITNKAGSAVILINGTHSPARLESTIMHEIAHNVLNHLIQVGEDFMQLNLIGRHHDARMEKEAEILGSILQIPDKGMLTLLNFGFDRARIAETFHCSEEMAYFRFKKCGFARRLKRTI